MNTKYVTSLELSKNLKEVGIPQESEWYWDVVEDKYNVKPRLVNWKDKEKIGEYKTGDKWKEYFVSALHVGELGEMLPATIDKGEKFWMLTLVKSYGIKEGQRKIYYCYYYSDPNSNQYKDCLPPTQSGFNEDCEAEARGKMLLYLKQNKLI